MLHDRRDVSEVTQLIYQAISKLEKIKNEMILELLKAQFNDDLQGSKLFDQGVWKEFMDYFKNFDDLEEAYESIEKFRRDAKDELWREMQETLRKLQEVHISIREFKER